VVAHRRDRIGLLRTTDQLCRTCEQNGESTRSPDVRGNIRKSYAASIFQVVGSQFRVRSLYHGQLGGYIALTARYA
jgi:hypothetical protein